MRILLYTVDSVKEKTRMGRNHLQITKADFLKITCSEVCVTQMTGFNVDDRE